MTDPAKTFDNSINGKPRPPHEWPVVAEHLMRTLQDTIEATEALASAMLIAGYPKPVSDAVRRRIVKARLSLVMTDARLSELVNRLPPPVPVQTEPKVEAVMAPRPHPEAGQ